MLGFKQIKDKKWPFAEPFEWIYHRFREPLIRYFFRRLRDRDLAEEAAQEVFTKAYRARASFDPSFGVSSWLWTIARNTLTDLFRKSGRALTYDDAGGGEQIDEIATTDPDPESILIERSERALLARGMAALTEQQRRVLSLRLVECLSYGEIARRLGMSLSAVKCLAHRARQRILNAATITVS